MTLSLANKQVLLGVTGSIAAYKSADLVRRLREAGAVVRVAMTENAKRFITPLTMQAVSGFPVHDDLFDVHAEAAMGHIELARWADVVVIAPATAGFMARLASGQADDLLTTLCLATKAPIAIAPAMNQGMWKHRLTQQNVQALKNKQIHLLEPEEGSQACGDVGPGRMMEPTEIVKKITALFENEALRGLNILVTAGPTHEAIDPVRFLTNGSSGKMGYSLATAAREAGGRVTLVSGPTAIPPPPRVEYIPVITGQEMYEEVMIKIAKCDIFLAVAAVSDYRCEKTADQKIHKMDASIQMTLVPNPDIAASVGQLAQKPFIVGFAAETENVEEQARAKRLRKKMDMIIANRVGRGVGMGSDENEVTVITASEEVHLPSMSKHRLAAQLVKIIADEFKRKRKL